MSPAISSHASSIPAVKGKCGRRTLLWQRRIERKRKSYGSIFCQMQNRFKLKCFYPSITVAAHEEWIFFTSWMHMQCNNDYKNNTLTHTCHSTSAFIRISNSNTFASFRILSHCMSLPHFLTVHFFSFQFSSFLMRTNHRAWQSSNPKKKIEWKWASRKCSSQARNLRNVATFFISIEKYFNVDFIIVFFFFRPPFSALL